MAPPSPSTSRPGVRLHHLAASLMRILTITNNYPPHFYGGYELTCRDVMDRFRLAGHDVTVLTSDVRVPGVVEPDGPDILRTLVAQWDWNHNRIDMPRGWLAGLRLERHNLRALRQALRLSRADVVSVWHMGGLSLSLLTVLERARLPVVLTIANDWLSYANLIDAWSLFWADWTRSWRPTSVLGVPVQPPSLSNAIVNFVSAFTRAENGKHGTWVFPNAAVVHPGIDLDDFPITPPINQPWNWRLLYVGRLEQQKGIATLIRAFAQLPREATLEVLGGGDEQYKQQMRELAAGLNVADRMSFGFCSRGELRDRYRAADAVVFPSEWLEPFGLVPIEAMACGVPVVATGTGGSAEFLSDGENCLLYPPGDVTQLVDRVTTLATRPEIRARVTEGGRHTAKLFTIDRYAAGLLSLHEQAAQQSSNRVPGQKGRR